MPETNVVHVDFRAKAPPSMPAEVSRTSEQIGLIGKAGGMFADALGAARALQRRGDLALAKERMITAARDLAAMYERTGLREFDQLAHVAARAAVEMPRRYWRRRPGSVVGLVRPEARDG